MTTITKKDMYYYEDESPPDGCTEYLNGKIWRENGQLHRVDGPAAELNSGDKYWYQNNFYFREGGLPAVEYANGNKEWWVNGRQYYYDPADELKEWERILWPSNSSRA